jgi:hypothetical protein
MLEVQPAQTRHANIEDKAARVLVVGAPVLKKITCRGERLHRIARRLNQPGERPAHGGVVIDDKDGGGGRRPRVEGRGGTGRRVEVRLSSEMRNL